jgi:hypothetical protein
LCGEVLGLLDVFNDVLIKPFVTERAVVTFNIGVLLRLSGLDVLDDNSWFFSPFFQLTG